MHRPTKPTHSGFTLVEILIVVLIIGILMALSIPAINGAINTARKAAIKVEVSNLAQAVESYRQKHDDYPPDGSNSVIFKRHLRKVFPRMLPSEMMILTASSAEPGVMGPSGNPLSFGMNPAEALVFFLGGFSDDPQHPFTGPGGPLTTIPGVSPVAYQYNTDRNPGFFEFKPERLTIDVTSAGATISTDEGLIGGASGSNDLLPVYLQANAKLPFVYFDSRTYYFTGGGGSYWNSYQYSTIAGAARPYKSTNKNTNVAVDTSTVGGLEASFKYMNDRTFQIVAPGRDGEFGGYQALQGSSAVLYQFPLGNSFHLTVNQVRYADGSDVNLQQDNITNFSDSSLEDSLEN